ncbi:MAG: SMI1/KNR4 family protein [bacterium]|nr:SMI1/KNR4 family protein [bacterium]
MFDNLDLSGLFETEKEYAEGYSFGRLTDEMIKRAEQNIGYRLPKAYIDLLKIKNGGVIKNRDLWLRAIYGISPAEKGWNSLELMFCHWIWEWEYPNIGIPFGETQSAGHDMYFMDFRRLNGSGEPKISLVDIETEEIRHIADSFEEFIYDAINCGKQE